MRVVRLSQTTESNTNKRTMVHSRTNSYTEISSSRSMAKTTLNTVFSSEWMFKHVLCLWATDCLTLIDHFTKMQKFCICITIGNDANHFSIISSICHFFTTKSDGCTFISQSQNRMVFLHPISFPIVSTSTKKQHSFFPFYNCRSIHPCSFRGNEEI